MGQFRYLLFAESRRTFADRDRKGCDQSWRVEFLCCHSLDLPKQANVGQMLKHEAANRIFGTPHCL